MKKIISVVGENFKDAEVLAKKIFAGKLKTGTIPKLWDGHTAEIIVEIIKDNL